ncbi:MAG: restriction endonuclease subunit S [Prolixibacteraceae bacterium]|jgi:type I restriction enzyme S subunit|nr:restriction endonuclease subunit S [Prolixibacteraceae bacterium]
MEWKKEKLKPLGWLRSAGVNKLIDRNQKEVCLINYMDVYRNHQISSKIDFQKVTAKEAEIKNANVLKGDILFTPSSEKPTDIGHAGVVMEELENTVYSYHLVRFRLYKPELFNPLFLSYSLNAYQAEKHFVTRATGTTRYTLSLSDFKSLEIEYPENLAEQTAIATILSKVDAAIEATQNSIKAAEKLKKALMQNLLTGKLKPDGTWRTDDEFYEDEKFGKVPKGWSRRQIKDVTIQIQYGLNVPSVEDGKYPMFRMNNIIDGKMVDKPMVSVNLPKREFERYKLDKFDILFNRTNSLDLVGKIGIFELDGDYVFASYLIRLKVNSENNPCFINYYLNSYQGQCSLRSKATPAVSQANINAKSLRNTYIPRPPKNEQDEIVSKFDQIEKNKEKLQTKILALQRLKKSLMQNLLTGKVRLDVERMMNCE